MGFRVEGKMTKYNNIIKMKEKAKKLLAEGLPDESLFVVVDESFEEKNNQTVRHNPFFHYVRRLIYWIELVVFRL